MILATPVLIITMPPPLSRETTLRCAMKIAGSFSAGK